MFFSTMEGSQTVLGVACIAFGLWQARSVVSNREGIVRQYIQILQDDAKLTEEFIAKGNSLSPNYYDRQQRRKKEAAKQIAKLNQWLNKSSWSKFWDWKYPPSYSLIDDALEVAEGRD